LKNTTLPYEVIHLAGKGDITIEKAALALDMKPKVVKQMLTLWGSRLGTLVREMKKLSQTYPSREAQSAATAHAAQALNVTTRQVNRLVGIAGIKKPRPLAVQVREKTSVKAQERYGIRQKYAICVIDGTMPMADAAENAEVCSRQMYRWVTKLLNGEGLVVRDLQKMTLPKRRQLANRIESEHVRQE